MKLTHGLTLPFALLSLATLFVYMGGLASIQNVCYTGGVPGLGGPGPMTSAPNGAFGLSSGLSSDCRRVYRFYWFIFAFVLVTLLGVLASGASYMALHVSRPFWIGMLSVSTILMMIASEAFLGMTVLDDDYLGIGGMWAQRIRCTTAGAIMTVAFLIFTMMGIGVDWEHRRGATTIDKPTSGVTTTAHPMAPATEAGVVEQV